MDRVSVLIKPEPLGQLALGSLWRLAEQLQFIRDNVDAIALAADFERHPTAQAQWAAYERRHAEVRLALGQSSASLAEQVRSGVLGPGAFRAWWQGLGYVPNDDSAGTPADDSLDALFHIARYTEGDPPPSGASPNMASRAERAADFLKVTEPTGDDVVFDLGSGSGKLALTVSASTSTTVVGVECGASYVDAARVTAGELGLHNARFIHADVRDTDLSRGSIFYLYYPFHGAVAQGVAETLGALAREKNLTVYSHGPSGAFGEYFLREVDRGSLTLSERRGAFGEVLVLRSRRR